MNSTMVLVWEKIKEKKRNILPRSHQGCSGFRRAVGSQGSRIQVFSGKQRKLTDEERKVENAEMCVCWGNTAIFNRMVRQRFIEKVALSQYLKGERS